MGRGPLPRDRSVGAIELGQGLAKQFQINGGIVAMIHDTTLDRRGFLKGGIVAAGTLTLGLPFRASARSHVFPSRQMEAIIGFAPGGGTDLSARVLAPAWQEALGADRPFLFVYAPGAGTLVSLRKMMSDPRPDGHTVHFTPINHTAWVFELRKPEFGLDDIAWVGSYFTDPDVLLVKKDAKWNRIDEFIEDARKSSRPFTVSVSSPMSAAHAATVVLRELTGANLKVIPFSGGSEARNAVAGGHVDACMAPYWSALPVLELTKAIGIFIDHNPAPHLWQPVPANQVLDVRVPDLVEPYAVQVHGKVRELYPDRYEKLVRSLRQAVASQTFRTAADAQNLTPFLRYMSPDECRKFVNDYLQLLKEFRPAMERDLR